MREQNRLYSRKRRERRDPAYLKHVGSHRARAKRYGVAYEPIDRFAVFERDRWMCALCGARVNRRLAYPHPRSASLDHLIPMSRGGAHLYANVACAHLDCNVAKNAAGGGEQLALVG